MLTENGRGADGDLINTVTDSGSFILVSLPRWLSWQQLAAMHY